MASPNLAAVNADSLWFSCRIALAAEHLDRLKAALGGQPPYDDLGFPFARNYRRGGKWHHEGAWLDRVERQAGDYELNLHYGLGRAGSVPATMRPVQLFLETLAAFQLKATLNCNAQFEYADGEWRSVIPLPLRLVESEALAFDELRGVRAVKVEDDKLAYSVILDRPDNKNYSYLVVLSYEGIIDTALPERILEEAARISALFIRPLE